MYLQCERIGVTLRPHPSNIKICHILRRLEMSWTPEQDAYVVWSFFMQPIAGLCDYLSIPDGRPVSELQDRFFEIMSSQSLQQRAYQAANGDLIQLKRVKFSRYEEFQAINAQRMLGTTNPYKILEAFGPCFHLTRSTSSIVAHCFLLQSHGCQTFKAQLTNYTRWCDSLVKPAAMSRLVEIPTTTRELDRFVWRKEPDRRRVVRNFKTVGQVWNHALGTFRKGDYFALRGPGNMFLCNKKITTIGRSGPDRTIDVDLKPFKLGQVSRVHAVISLCSDGMFYVECKGKNIIVNGIVFLAGEWIRLAHGDLLDIGGYPCLFIEHQEHMEELRKDVCKGN